MNLNEDIQMKANLYISEFGLVNALGNDKQTIMKNLILPLVCSLCASFVNAKESMDKKTVLW